MEGDESLHDTHGDVAAPTVVLSEHAVELHGGHTESLLFPGLSTTSAVTFVLACVILAIGTAIIEICRFFIQRIEERLTPSENKFSASQMCKCGPQSYSTFPASQLEPKSASQTDPSETRANLIQMQLQQPPLHQMSRARRSMYWFLVAVLQFLTSIMALLSMLFAMTMNVYIIISLAFGATVGRVIVISAKKKITNHNGR